MSTPQREREFAQTRCTNARASAARAIASAGSTTEILDKVIAVQAAANTGISDVAATVRKHLEDLDLAAARVTITAAADTTRATCAAYDAMSQEDMTTDDLAAWCSRLRGECDALYALMDRITKQVETVLLQTDAATAPSTPST